jgi:hypothetical protein
VQNLLQWLKQKYVPYFLSMGHQLNNFQWEAKQLMAEIGLPLLYQ